MPVNMIALQKMVYMANALYSLESGKPLVSEKPIIGIYDPEFTSFHSHLHGFKADNIRHKLRHTNIIPTHNVFRILPFVKEPTLPDDVISVLKLICSYYTLAKYDFRKLTRFTGGDSEQWAKMVEASGGLGQEIPNNIICEYFYNAVMNLKDETQFIKQHQLVADVVRFPHSALPIPLAI